VNIDKEIITDLYKVIQSQHRVISYLVANNRALVETLANDSALSNFVDGFQNRQEYALKHPAGHLSQALGELERMLASVGEKLKAGTGGWEN
jgi:HD-like signal output (HDOD) protein